MGPEYDRQLRVGELRYALQSDGDRFTHAQLLSHSRGERVIEPTPGLFRHPERAVTESGGTSEDVAAEACDLVVVNGGGPVHRLSLIHISEPTRLLSIS